MWTRAPIENGDFVVRHLKSLGGLDEPVDQDNLQMEVGGADTLPALTEDMLGAQPEETKEFDDHLSGGLWVGEAGRQNSPIPD